METGRLNGHESSVEADAFTAVNYKGIILQIQLMDGKVRPFKVGKTGGERRVEHCLI